MMLLTHSGGCVKINRNNLTDVEHGHCNPATSTSFLGQILEVLDERDSKWILGLITYNIVIIYYLCSWVTSTNSIALSAYANTIFFNVFALLVCLISIWVERNNPASRNFPNDPEPLSIFGPARLPKAAVYPEYQKSFGSQLQISSGHVGHVEFVNDPIQRDGRKNDNRELEKRRMKETGDESFDSKSISSMGLEKYEVLALLVSACLSLMAGSVVSVQVVARISDQPSVHTGRLGLGVLLGFLAHLGTIIGYPDAGLNHVVCKALPCPTLRGCNPILGGNMISALILTGTHLVIHFWEIHVTDTAAALAVLGLTATSMLPLAFYTFNLILQKLPGHMYDQLDSCIREALIIDGVLEFRNERFWAKSFGKLAGTLQVRVRRNANENHVLESVMRRLSKIVSTLTIQKFHESRTKDFSDDRPVEYYINEILQPLNDNTDEKSRRQKDLSSAGPSDVDDDMDKDIRVMRIDDIIRIDDSEIETFAIRSSFKTKTSFHRTNEKRSIARANQTTLRPLTIYKNDNVRVKDRIWRGDETKKNALLYGTKIDCKEFENVFIITERN